MKRRPAIGVVVAALVSSAFSACVGDDPVLPASAADDAGSVDGAGAETAPGDAASTTDGPDSGEDPGPPPASTGTLTWAAAIVGDNVSGNSVAFDGLGNVFVGGGYLSSTVIDFGNGKTLPANTGSYDGYIAKFNATGLCQWAVALTGTGVGDRVVIALAAAPGGEVAFVADTQSSTVKLDKAAVPGLGGSDVTVGQLDPSGSQKWLRVFGSANGESPQAIAVDATGRVAIAGTYIRNTAVDISFDGITANPPQSPNGQTFVAILDASGTAKSLKAFTVGNAIDAGVSRSMPHALAFDPSGNLVVGGEFYGSLETHWAEASSKSHTSAGQDDAWIAEIDLQNKTKWSVAFGLAGADSIHGVASDSQGNVYATFGYQGNVVVTKTPLPSFGIGDVGIARFDPTGTILGANGYGSVMNEVPTNIAVDRWNEVIVSGLMNGDVNFGKPAMAYGGGDGFVAKLSPASDGLWAYGIGSSAIDDEANSVAVDKAGNVAISGKVQPNPAASILGKGFVIPAGKSAAFVAVTTP
jgi:hypothetical protein